MVSNKCRVCVKRQAFEIRVVEVLRYMKLWNCELYCCVVYRATWRYICCRCSRWDVDVTRNEISPDRHWEQHCTITPTHLWMVSSSSSSSSNSRCCCCCLLLLLPLLLPLPLLWTCESLGLLWGDGQFPRTVYWVENRHTCRGCRLWGHARWNEFSFYHLINTQKYIYIFLFIFGCGLLSKKI